ncbi:hypothetical protein B0H63DRAFT_15416 [Podospora didyma]|uniref:Allergen Asp f 4 n=1 Tax=Podospora didyma TaxID=330526 RepID=A0AAE0U7D9_9PEZI|nr:hypothetical protein B0H63DRAFT_15416 [Podospora didyma]
MQLSTFLFLAGTIAVSAHPSGHAHLHRAAHTKRDEPVFVKAIHKPIEVPTVAAASVAAPSSSVAAAPKAAPSAPVAAANAASKPSSSSGEAKRIPFCSEGGGSKVKRVTEAQVKYVGNIGMKNGCAWNSNMMLVDNTAAKFYDYVQTYTNVAGTSYEVICSNKMGPTGENTGSFKVASQTPLTFTLAPGETKTIVTEANTQGVCAFAPGSVPTTPYGQYAGNWIEFDTANQSNGGWSGADVSALVTQHYDMDVPGGSVCGHGTCSTIYPGGRGVNAYTKGMEEVDGVGLNIPAGAVTLEIKVGIS